MAPPWQRFAIGAAAAVIALLLTSNLLLLKLVLNDHRGGTAAQTTKPSQPAALPALPAPSTKGTSQALLKELDKTKRQLQAPLSQALTGLDSVGASVAELDQMRLLLGQMAASTTAFGDAAPSLRDVDKRMRSLDKQITRMSSFALSFGPVMTDLEITLRTMRDDLSKIRACTEKPDSCK